MFESHLTWLWTWSGKCFGYREGDYLFALEGLAVGKFVGREVYGIDGFYLGETGPGDEAAALATNLYKKSRTQPRFVPLMGEPKQARPAKAPRPFYAGHEDFPTSAELIASISRQLPPDIQRALKGRRQPGALKATSH